MRTKQESMGNWGQHRPVLSPPAVDTRPALMTCLRAARFPNRAVNRAGPCGMPGEIPIVRRPVRQEDYYTMESKPRFVSSLFLAAALTSSVLGAACAEHHSY